MKPFNLIWPVIAILLLLLLPLVPLESAPVVPHASYRLVWQSLIVLLWRWFTPWVGVHDRLTWGTLPVLLALLTALGWAVYYLIRQVNRNGESHGQNQTH